MRFHLGGVPNDPDFVPDGTWKALREPSPWLMQLYAFPLGLIAFGGIGALWFCTTNLKASVLDSPGFIVLGFLAFFPLIVAHELIHALVHPQFGRSERSILGFWPSRLLFYAHYAGELSRNRFLAICAMPMLVITILPSAFCMATGHVHGLIAWISTWNAFFACGDMFGIILINFQVPSRAGVRNQGWKTYWRIAGNQTQVGPN